MTAAEIEGIGPLVEIVEPSKPTKAANSNGHNPDRPTVLSRSDPYRTAATYLKECRHHPEGRTLHLHRGSWYVYTGTHYREASTDEIKAELYWFLGNAVCMMKSEEGEIAYLPFRPTRKHLFDLVDTVRARALVLDDVPVPSWLGRAPTKGIVVPMANGLLDLPTGHLHEHSPAYLQTYSLPFAYDSCAPEPVEWLKFLDTLWPDDREAIDLLQEIIGLLLTDDTSHHKLFMLVGPARSGKGTIARVIQELLGKINVAGPTLSDLSSNFGLQAMIGKPVAIIADARLSGRADAQAIAERLLSISGEDRLQVDRKNREPWTGTLPTRIVMLTNKLPAIADASGAMASRFVILTMKESFLGREDHGLLARLLPERPGIFNWALKGRDRLATRGHFVMPKSSQEAVRDLQRSSSPIMAFLSDRCVMNAASSIGGAELYGAWRVWCVENGRDHIGTIQTFGLDLAAAIPGLKTTRPRGLDGKQTTHYTGVRLLAYGEPNLTDGSD